MYFIYTLYVYVVCAEIINGSHFSTVEMLRFASKCQNAYRA